MFKGDVNSYPVALQEAKTKQDQHWKTLLTSIDQELHQQPLQSAQPAPQPSVPPAHPGITAPAGRGFFPPAQPSLPPAKRIKKEPGTPGIGPFKG